jgi:Protein of unknown function (DUF3617)
MKKSVVSFTTCIATCAAVLCASLAQAEGMKPGLWEFTTQMGGADMPAMPKISDTQRKQMEAMGIKMPPQAAGGGMAFTTKTCITPEQAQKGIPPNAEKNGEKCEQTDVKTSGKTTSWKMVCSGKHKMTGSGSMTYDSADHFSGETTMNMTDGPQGPMAMNNNFNGTFISADCKQSK